MNYYLKDGALFRSKKPYLQGPDEVLWPDGWVKFGVMRPAQGEAFWSAAETLTVDEAKDAAEELGLPTDGI